MSTSAIVTGLACGATFVTPRETLGIPYCVFVTYIYPISLNKDFLNFSCFITRIASKINELFRTHQNRVKCQYNEAILWLDTQQVTTLLARTSSITGHLFALLTQSRPAVTGSQTQDTSSLSHQCSATEP